VREREVSDGFGEFKTTKISFKSKRKLSKNLRIGYKTIIQATAGEGERSTP
jgi:hypothetical protein